MTEGSQFHLCVQGQFDFHWFSSFCLSLYRCLKRRLSVISTSTYPFSAPFFLDATHTDTHTYLERITRAHVQPAHPPSRPPPWAAGAQGFPRVSDWRLDSPSLIKTVITECHLSMFFPFRHWEKQAAGQSRSHWGIQMPQVPDPLTCINIITQQWLLWPNRSSNGIMLEFKVVHFGCYEFDCACKFPWDNSVGSSDLNVFFFRGRQFSETTVLLRMTLPSSGDLL